MTLSDHEAYRYVIGCLMYRPQLLLEYPDIQTYDFDSRVVVICFNTIKRLYSSGRIVELSPVEIEQEILRVGGAAAQIYKSEGGLEFLKNAYEYTKTLGNFDYYYTRLKKYSLLRKLKKAHYDISQFYLDPKEVTNPLDEVEAIRRFDNATLEDILASVEKDYAEIRNDFLGGRTKQGDPAEKIVSLINELKTQPSIGPDLEGHIFSSICRGAREGCFFLKSASTSGGKSRTSVFDACHLAYPKRWSHEKNKFIEIVNCQGEPIQPRKVLFIVTEMDKQELQTIMLAYLSGVDEDKILRGAYEPGEYTRVLQAAAIMKEYSGYFMIEEISEPNLQNVEATIRKYATVDQVKYVFFDYIHSTASMIEQFTRNNVREDVILMMMANQLKQLAKDYKIFIFSATQVNSLGMGDDELTFKDEKCIRGSKAVADKADMAFVMSRIPEKFWNGMQQTLKIGVRDRRIPQEVLDNPPTHVLDVYKMRRGRYKMIRIWTRLHLGTGERKDLFITSADNQIFDEPIDLFSSYSEREIEVKKVEGD